MQEEKKVSVRINKDMVIETHPSKVEEVKKKYAKYMERDPDEAEIYDEEKNKSITDTYLDSKSDLL